MIEAKGKVLAFVGDQVDAKYVIEKSGAKATDKEDGDLTAKIEVEGKVDTSCAGESKVTLKVTDSQGATGNKEVTVKVVKINDTIEVKEKISSMAK